jgi:hypothetical protein
VIKNIHGHSQGRLSIYKNMKTKPIDRMKDPFFAGLIFQIEQMIHITDQNAEDSKIKLTDSQVRSVIIKARKLIQGEEPNWPTTPERDRILADLAMIIFHAPDHLMEQTTEPDGTTKEEPLKISDWLKALESVQTSIELRRSKIPGSRNYLDFLTDFILRAQEMS